MRARTVYAPSAALAAGAALLALQSTAGQPQTAEAPAAPATLRPLSEFAGISDPRARALALFQEAGKVITHARCVNCHPATESPLQTDRMRPHEPLVVRGADGHGAPGLRCDTCHGKVNYDPARVPGHPEWHLAPASMAWEGKTLGQICAQIKDPAHNGGKNLAAIVRHMAEDLLVGWGWSPGPGRQPAPGTQAEFGALIRAWAESGAHCPS
jgi:hypothetical protein